ncbi:hypothetical protein MVES_001574 [Malassezia vespertilionis]|uniref:BHLH domain-containing protein n=1 Tax=Malassezia vespertilionis TaxID=2020962 RepID=A0A2N1JDN4_9BASI|nr:hypothetical protein MVES_001574 [Malassezia vespertilionis]
MSAPVPEYLATHVLPRQQMMQLSPSAPIEQTQQVGHTPWTPSPNMQASTDCQNAEFPMTHTYDRGGTPEMTAGRLRRNNSDGTEISDIALELDDIPHSDGDVPEEQPTQGQMQIPFEVKRLMERRRRRRESHNAVERRRRDNINSQITELATLLPETMLVDALSSSLQGGNSGSWTFGPDTAQKAAKNREQLATWCQTNMGYDEQDSSENAQDPREPIPASSCLRISSMKPYAASLAPVNFDNPALAAAQAKPNKGIILRKSVEYIRQLQQFLDIQMQRNRMLETELRTVYRQQDKTRDRATVVPPVLLTDAYLSEGSSHSALGKDRTVIKQEAEACPVQTP